jgi:hypothetical protein
MLPLRIVGPLALALMFVVWGFCCQRDGSPFLSLLAIPWYAAILAASFWAVWRVGTSGASVLLRYCARSGAAIALSVACFVVSVSVVPLVAQMLSPTYRVVDRVTGTEGAITLVAERKAGWCSFVRWLPCP